MKPDPKLIAAFDDLISEKDLMIKTGYSKRRLAELRKKGQLTASTLSGRKLMYSKTELAKALNLQGGSLIFLK